MIFLDTRDLVDGVALIVPSVAFATYIKHPEPLYMDAGPSMANSTLLKRHSRNVMKSSCTQQSQLVRRSAFPALRIPVLIPPVTIC